MKLLKKILAGCAFVLFASAAHAAVIQIQVSGINAVYNEATGEFCDTGGGLGCFAAADSLLTMNFLSDGALIGSLTNPPTSLAFNMLLNLPAGTNPALNATTPIVASAFDVFDFQIGGVPGLFTDITTGSVTFSNTSVNATGTGFASIFAQNLPFGLVANNPINWSFSSGLGACTGAVGSRICTYAGTGELSWVTQTVPEPSALLLLGTGILALSVTGLRRRG
jgi:hypothetical protein